jgi:(5-formylfuran-3-yl)methyl phosphate synthase
MININFSSQNPALLVSVRNTSEALAALTGGADVIDVKEPDRGPLGRADPSTIAAVVRAVAGRAPVTVALGELPDLMQCDDDTLVNMVPDEVTLIKIGLAGCREIANWQSLWRRMNKCIASRGHRPIGPVAVIYADWRAAGAPSPDQVASAAIESRCPALLVDTWDKTAGSLFNHWPIDELRLFLKSARGADLPVALAGSLSGDDFTMAVGLNPELIAVRTAACDGGRAGTVACSRVRQLKVVIAETLAANQAAATKWA